MRLKPIPGNGSRPKRVFSTTKPKQVSIDVATRKRIDQFAKQVANKAAAKNTDKWWQAYREALKLKGAK